MVSFINFEFFFRKQLFFFPDRIEKDFRAEAESNGIIRNSAYENKSPPVAKPRSMETPVVDLTIDDSFSDVQSDGKFFLL